MAHSLGADRANSRDESSVPHRIMRVAGVEWLEWGKWWKDAKPRTAKFKGKGAPLFYFLLSFILFILNIRQ